MKDADYISPQTEFSQSFLISLGYSLELIKNGEDEMDDVFMVRWKNKHIPFWNSTHNVPYVKRKQFFDFARHRHDTLRRAPMRRKILYAID